MATPRHVESFLHSLLHGRALMLAGAVLVGGVLALTAANVYILIRSHDNPPNPLQSPSPEQIVDKLPVYHVGDTINVLGTKCNTSKKPVLIRGTSFWQSMERGGPDGSVPSNGNTSTGRQLPPGCMALTFPHKIPDGVTPGNWQFTGEDCTPDGQCTDWFTDVFVVAP